MRILHFFKSYYPETFGGCEEAIYQLAEGGRALGITAEVLSLSRRGTIRNEPYAHHISHRSQLDFEFASTGFSISVFRDFAQLAKNADIVHYHFPWPMMDLVHFATRVNKPTVLTYHSDVVKQKHLLKLYQPLQQRFLSSVDRIVAESPNYAESSPVLARFRSKLSIIPIGQDKVAQAQPSAEQQAYWKQRLGEQFFLFVGALRYYKGLTFLLQAALGAPYPIVIMGAGPDEHALKQQARQLGLRQVHFLGALPESDKVALYQLCYGFVFPSHLRSESYGIALLEAAMHGKPMISCEIGTGTSFINLHNETGLVVPAQSPESLRQAMDELWTDPLKAKVYGQQAEKRYNEVFTSKLMVERYADLYRGLLGGGAAQ